MTFDALPPRRSKTFAHFEDKLRELQRAKVPVKIQLATIDWWIAKLLQLKAQIEAGSRI